MNPAGSQRVPPEERLLSLIRGKKPQAPAAEPVTPAPSPRVRRRQALRLPGWWLRALTGLCAVVLVGQLVALVSLAMKPLPDIDVQVTPSAPAREPAPSASALEPLPTLSGIASRPIFEAATEPQPSATPSRPVNPGPSAQSKALASRLSLLGIVAGNPPQAIIEDSQTKKTYFVTVGQTVVEGLIVEQVFENRVILDLQGEKVELIL